MSMQIAIFFMILFMFSLPVAAVDCKSELNGLSVFLTSEKKAWSITWKEDGVHKSAADYYGNLKNRTNIQDSRGDNRSESLPQTLLKSDEQFNIPFDVSQNGDFLIAAIYKRQLVLLFSKQLAIVDVKKQKIVKIIETQNYIESLAWSPDDKYFAVLYKQDVTKQVFKGPMDWFARLAGHPISYDTWYLSLYKVDGTLLCTAQVAEKLPLADGYLDWEKGSVPRSARYTGTGQRTRYSKQYIEKPVRILRPSKAKRATFGVSLWNFCIEWVV